MDLGGWLRSLGLERYEVAFRENEIDDAVLPNLTAEGDRPGHDGASHHGLCFDRNGRLRQGADASR